MLKHYYTGLKSTYFYFKIKIELTFSISLAFTMVLFANQIKLMYSSVICQPYISTGADGGAELIILTSLSAVPTTILLAKWEHILYMNRIYYRALWGWAQMYSSSEIKLKASTAVSSLRLYVCCQLIPAPQGMSVKGETSLMVHISQVWASVSLSSYTIETNHRLIDGAQIHYCTALFCTAASSYSLLCTHNSFELQIPLRLTHSV